MSLLTRVVFFACWGCVAVGIPARAQDASLPPAGPPSAVAPEASAATNTAWEEEDRDPVCVSELRVPYPLGSRLRGEEGNVTLAVKVDADGRVKDVTVVESSGYHGLDAAAAAAVRKAPFSPAHRHGQAAEGVTMLVVRFRLTD
jgi:protein TonB